MRPIINLLILVLILSCNQTTEKQQANFSEGQEENTLITMNDEENFETLDVEGFNDFLAKEKSYSKIEVMLLFYPGEIEPPKDSEKADFQEEVLANGNTLVTLIHDNLENDSLKGYKYILELKRKNNKWMVVSAKSNWRYYDGKGHTHWGIEQLPTSESIRDLETNKIEMAEEDEQFQYLTMGFFNRHLGTLTDELSGEEVMRLFIPKEESESNEGNEIETIHEKILENGNMLVTLIQDNLMDDSIKGEKYVMELEKFEGTWNAVYIKKNWKCREGRGHTDWGVEMCL